MSGLSHSSVGGFWELIGEQPWDNGATCFNFFHPNEGELELHIQCTAKQAFIQSRESFTHDEIKSLIRD